MAAARNILVRAPNFLGDHVMAIPFYRRLRESYPTSRLTLLGTSAILGLPLSSGVFDETISLDRALGAWRAGRGLRGRGFDLGVTLPASLSSALLLFAAGIATRTGYCSEGSDLFLTASLSWPGRSAGRHKSTLYLELAEFLTGRRLPPFPVPPLEISSREKLVVIAPEASLPLREWPEFPAFLADFRRNFPDYRVVVVGTGEKWRARLARLGDPGVEDRIGRTSLPELLALFRGARLVIANDSGPAHLAAHAGAPVLTLFGPGDPRYVTPLGPRVETAQLDGLPCRPCERTWCARPYGYQACLRGLGVETVMAKTAGLLVGFPA